MGSTPIQGVAHAPNGYLFVSAPILAAAGHSLWAEFSTKHEDLLIQIEKATKSFVTDTVNISDAHTKDGRHVRGKVRSAGGYYVAELEIADHPDELTFFAA